MSLAFHSRHRKKIALLNNSMYKSTPILQVSYTANNPSESFITIKMYYLLPRCGGHEQAAAFKLSNLAIQVVFSSYLNVGCAVSFCFGDTHP